MGFEEFGTVSFTSQTKVNHFVERLRQGKVSGTRCKTCGIPFFPPRADCSECLSSEMDWFDVTGTGKLIAHSTLSYAPTGFEQDLPYTVALARFSGNTQIFGRLCKTIKPEETSVGMELSIAPVELPGGRIAYEFQKP
jgi:uncharacterized OB-fold protein